MKTYDVQELLRQQKNNIKERILTILLAVSLGICSSMIYDEITNNSSPNLFQAPLIFIIILLGSVLIPVVLNKDLIKVKEEFLTALICLNLDNDPKLIQFTDYPFSIQAENNWRLMIETKNEIIEKFKKAHKNQNYTNDDENFDYILITDLFQYSILKNISSNSSKKQNLLQFESIDVNKVENKLLDFLFYFKKYNRINHLLNHFFVINKRYEKRKKLDKLQFFVEGIPLICLPKKVQNNLFVSTFHGKQAEYEKRIFEQGEDILSFSYVPFRLSFPDYISVKFEDSNYSRIDKIIFIRKNVGKLTIEFHDRWRYLSQRAFSLTTMRPGNRYNHFEEIFFEISTDIYIKKYAYFPLIGGGERKTDEFLSWANELVEKLNKSCDWDYYQQNITRDTLAEINNKIDYHNWESNIEYYSNFSDNAEGETKRLLRLLLSPNFEYSKVALKKIEEYKDRIPCDQLESVILRILRLFKNPNESTQYLAAKTLACFLTEIPNNLHEKTIEELLKLTNSKDDFVRLQSLKNLEALFIFIYDENLKEKIQDKIISVHSSKDENIARLYYEAIINRFYPKIDSVNRNKFEKHFLQILESQDKELIDNAFIFFTFVSEFISKELIIEIFYLSSKIKICELQVQSIEYYLTFLANISSVILSKSLDDSLSEPIKRHYKILISLISNENENNESKSNVIRRFSIIRPFFNLLRTDQKEVIYTKLKLLLYVQNKHIKFSSLETICYVADIFPGREDDIARTLLENVDSEYEEIDVQYYVVSGLNKIRSKITDQVLMEEIVQFIQIVETRDDTTHNDAPFKYINIDELT